jgi:hypothetical protein
MCKMADTPAVDTDRPTLVEHVARALCRDWWDENSGTLPDELRSGEICRCIVENNWPDFVDTARIAIAAMREPAPEVTAAVGACFEGEEEKHLKIGVWLQGHYAGVDAALAACAPEAA